MAGLTKIVKGAINGITIDSSQDIGLGTTSPDNASGWNKVLHQHSSGGLGSHIRFTDTGTGASGDRGTFIGQYSGNYYLINRESGGGIIFYNGTSETTRITSSGIHLGGTGSANALDDYEEGTYTVSAYDFYTGGNQSSTTATGYYTKIGRICHVFFTLNDIDTTGMTSSNEMFFNLPFTIGVTSQGGDIPNIRTLNATITADIIGTSMVSGNSRFNLLKYDYDGNLSATLVSNFNSGASDLTRVNITYMTN